MALVKCKECGNQVSTKAESCPSCGMKLPKKIGLLGWTFIILIVLPISSIMTLLLIGSLVGDSSPTAPETKPSAVVQQPTNTPQDSKAKNTTACDAIYGMALIIMKGRQEGESKGAFIESTRDTEIAEQLKVLINAAYQYPIQDTQAQKNIAISEFSNKIKAKCLEKYQ